MKDDLTIILTLKDRSLFTYRWMRWMEEAKCPFKILIADGGKDKEVQKYLENKSNHPDLNYEYIRYPYDKDFHTFFYKIADVASRVQTKYVISADNDDFFLIKALTRNLEFFKENQEYISVSSPHFRLRIDRPFKSRDDLVYAKDFPISIQRHPMIRDNENMLSDSAVVRFRRMVQRFYSGILLYAIHLTDNVQRVFRTIRDLDFTQLHFHEWYLLYSYSISGKMYFDYPESYLVRQDNTSQAAASTYAHENHAVITLMPGWTDNLYKMIDQLFGELSEKEDIGSKEEFYEFFRSLFAPYMLDRNEFRGLALKLNIKKYRIIHKMATTLYNIYRDPRILMHPRLSRSAIKKNPELFQLKKFLQSPAAN